MQKWIEKIGRKLCHKLMNKYGIEQVLYLTTQIKQQQSDVVTVSSKTIVNLNDKNLVPYSYILEQLAYGISKQLIKQNLIDVFQHYDIEKLAQVYCGTVQCLKKKVG